MLYLLYLRYPASSVSLPVWLFRTEYSTQNNKERTRLRRGGRRALPSGDYKFKDSCALVCFFFSPLQQRMQPLVLSTSAQVLMCGRFAAGQPWRLAAEEKGKGTEYPPVSFQAS